MACHHVQLPGGGHAIVCGSRRRRPPKCVCGSGLPADLLCDWKTGPGKTCDLAMCARCTTKPAEGKDLCPGHAKAWRAWLAAKGVPESST